MAANKVEELENKMGIEMKAVRALMLDRFFVVDQKLTAIEELLKKLVETKNQTGNQPETGSFNYGNQTEKDMGERGFETSKNRDEVKKVIGGRDGVHSHERRVKITLDNSGKETDNGLRLDDRGREGSPWEGSNPYGWVGLYTSHHDKDNLPRPDFGMRHDFCGPALVGQQELGFRTKNRSSFGFHYRPPQESSAKSKFDKFFIDNWPRTQRGMGQEGLGQKMVKAEETEWVEKKSENDTEKGWGSWGNKDVKKGQDNLVKDSLTSDEWRIKDSWADSSSKVADKMDAVGEKEEHTGSWASWRKKKDDKTDVPQQYSSTADQCSKKDYGSWSKEVQNERHGKWRSVGSDRGHVWSKKVEEKTDTKDGWGPWVKKCDNRPHAQVAAERFNEKDYKESQKPGSCGGKEEGWGPKRKRPNSPVGEPTDALRSNGLFTATRQRFDMFTSDEQEILNDFDPIVQSVQRIMSGYNDGDPLSPDDQTYILDNVFNYHPGKAQKMGAGIDYIMVSNHLKFPGSRCFYIVTTDGRKEDFSYRKCLESFLRGKYPDKVIAFMRKYFKPLPQPHPAGNRGHG